MKNYIYYIIAAIAAYLLFFRKKASTPAPVPPAPAPQPAPPTGGINISPGFPSDCPYTNAQACEKWKLEQEQNQTGDTVTTPPSFETDPGNTGSIAEQKPPFSQTKPPVSTQRPPATNSPRIPTDEEIAAKAAAEREQQERLKAQQQREEFAKQEKKAIAAGKSTQIREELSPKKPVALKNTLKASAWDRIAY
jgi:hypothetical protein